MKNKQELIPIFYACDDAFIKYTVVSIRSMLDNADKNRRYKIYVLNDGITQEMKYEVYKLNNDYATIEFVCVKEQLNKIGKTLPLRDYYSKTTYFRMFIAEMFPEYDKAVYIDSDTVVLGDISEFYDADINDYYVGACHEQVMIQTEVFGNYVEKVMGVDRFKYFNAGHILINCKAFRENHVLEQFIELLSVYTFVVTQDEDYLNVICKDKVYWMEDGWNTEVYGDIPVLEKDIKVIHYIMVSKPWHYEECRLKEYFWQYASQTSVYDLIMQDFNGYTDEKRANDIASCEKLKETARCEALREDTYLNLISKKKPQIDLKFWKKSVDTNLKESLILT